MKVWTDMSNDEGLLSYKVTESVPLSNRALYKGFVASMMVNSSFINAFLDRRP